MHRFSIRGLKLRPLIWPGASHTPPETQQKRASTTPCQLRLPWPTRLVRRRETAQQSRSRIAIPGPAPLKHLGEAASSARHSTLTNHRRMGHPRPRLPGQLVHLTAGWDHWDGIIGMGWDGMGPPRSTLLEVWNNSFISQ